MPVFRMGWTRATRTAFALVLSGTTLLACSEQSPVEPLEVALSEQSLHSNNSDAPPASLGWNELARSLIAANAVGPLPQARGLALLANAQYGAVTDDHRKHHAKGRRHAEFERGAIAGASSVVLTYLFPASAAAIAQRVTDEQAAAKTRHFARGVEAGTAMGNRMVAWGNADRSTAPFTGTIPVGPGLWTRNPAPPGGTLPPIVAPTFGGVAPYFLRSGDQFRSETPPVFDSPTYKAALAEIRMLSDTRTAEQLAIAQFWNPKGPAYWNQLASELITQRGLDEEKATHVLALMQSSILDAAIGCWEAKFYYWYIRPSQADPDITLPIGLPNHPSYPSGHSCLSGAATTVLAHFFPRERKDLRGKMEEAGLSRMYGGLHYDFDIDAGQELGKSVARYAIRFDERKGVLFRIP